MFRQIRAAFSRTLPTLCTLLIATPLLAAEPPRPDWKDAQTLPQLVGALERWLDENSPYAARESTPPIRMISLQRAYAISGQAMREGSRPRGFYDEESQVIYLVRPWSHRDPHDVSVLLHELTHHRQATAQHWYCPGAMELPAYKMQEAWLSEQGETGRINWVAAVLEGSCRPRDMHPD